MSSSRGDVRPGAAAALVCACAALLAGAARAHEEPPLEGPANTAALRVNQQIIGLREVESLFLENLPLIEEKLRHGILRPAQREEAVRAAWTEALQTAVQDAVLDQLGRERREEIIHTWVRGTDPGVPSARVMDAFRRMEEDAIRSLRRQKVEAAGGEAQLRAALKRKGQRIEDWEASLRLELFRLLVLNQSMSPVTSSPAGARAFYDAHPEQFRQEETWRLRRIRILKSKYTTPKNAELAAALLYEKLADGLDFAQLAALQEDPPFSAQGGVLALDGKADAPAHSFPAEEAIAAKLKDGEFSAPADVGPAILIVKREQHQPAEIPPYAAVQQKAESLAYAEKVLRKKREFFERQKQRTFVEVLQADPPPQYLK